MAFVFKSKFASRAFRYISPAFLMTFWSRIGLRYTFHCWDGWRNFRIELPVKLGKLKKKKKCTLWTVLADRSPHLVRAMWTCSCSVLTIYTATKSTCLSDGGRKESAQATTDGVPTNNLSDRNPFDETKARCSWPNMVTEVTDSTSRLINKYSFLQLIVVQRTHGSFFAISSRKWLCVLWNSKVYFRYWNIPMVISLGLERIANSTELRQYTHGR